MVGLGIAPHRGLGVLEDLVRLGLAELSSDVAAAGRHGGRSADIRAGGHVGKVGRHRDERPGAGSLGPSGADPHDRRDAGVQVGDYVGHRGQGSAQSIELDDHRGGMIGYGALDAAVDVGSHDVVYDTAGGQDHHFGTSAGG